MSALHALTLACYALGVVLTVLAAVAALVLSDTLDRVHLLTLATTLGVPLVGLGLALQNGWSMTTATVVFTCALLALSGPVLTAATGRVTAQRQGLVDQESPE